MSHGGRIIKPVPSYASRLSGGEGDNSSGTVGLAYFDKNAADALDEIAGELIHSGGQLIAHGNKLHEQAQNLRKLQK